MKFEKFRFIKSLLKAIMDEAGLFIATLNNDKVNSQSVSYDYLCVAPACDPRMYSNFIKKKGFAPDVEYGSISLFIYDINLYNNEYNQFIIKLIYSKFGRKMLKIKSLIVCEQTPPNSGRIESEAVHRKKNKNGENGRLLPKFIAKYWRGPK